MEKEFRVLSAEGAEVRSTGGRQVAGYGIVFNSRSELMGNFREIILPEAIEGVLEKSDVLALLNHDESRGILARSDMGRGTLTLTPERKGLKYSFESPNTSLGDELIEGLKRKDIKSSSFAFSLAQGGDKWDKQADGTFIRTITKIDKIWDVSPCFRPAYSDTSVALRSLEAFSGQKQALPTEAQLRAEFEALKAKQPRGTTDIRTTMQAQQYQLDKEIAYADSLKKPNDIYAKVVDRGKQVKPAARVKPNRKGKPVIIPEDEKKLKAEWEKYKREHPNQ